MCVWGLGVLGLGNLYILGTVANQMEKNEIRVM